MRISGITSCVGELYARYLARTLPVWMETLDSLVVVTDLETEIRVEGTMKLVRTSRFTDNGASFNKGAALNEAHRIAAPKDWILSFDCDTEPPPDWRKITEPLIEPGYLFGARRSKRHSTPFKPFGYFQLWHASDPSPPSPPFAECYSHAGRYDTVFLEHWHPYWHGCLPFWVKHHGRPMRHWFGVGNEHLTKQLMRNGVAAYRAADEKLQESIQ